MLVEARTKCGTALGTIQGPCCLKSTRYYIDEMHLLLEEEQKAATQRTVENIMFTRPR